MKKRGVGRQHLECIDELKIKDEGEKKAYFDE